MKSIRVIRNRYGKPGQLWLVTCSLCAGENEPLFLGALFGAGMKGWAPTWQIAQDYATRHALAHESTRCTTCAHVPAKPIADERTAACS